MAEQGCRLFVGNLSWSTTDESMREAFEQGSGVPGCVIDSKVILDRETNRSRYVFEPFFFYISCAYLCCRRRPSGES